MGHPRSRFVSQLITAVESPDREASFIGGEGPGWIFFLGDRNRSLAGITNWKGQPKYTDQPKYTELGKFSRNPMIFLAPNFDTHTHTA